MKDFKIIIDIKNNEFNEFAIDDLKGAIRTLLFMNYDVDKKDMKIKLNNVQNGDRKNENSFNNISNECELYNDDHKYCKECTTFDCKYNKNINSDHIKRTIDMLLEQLHAYKDTINMLYEKNKLENNEIIFKANIDNLFSLLHSYKTYILERIINIYNKERENK